MCVGTAAARPRSKVCASSVVCVGTAALGGVCRRLALEEVCADGVCGWCVQEVCADGVCGWWVQEVCASSVVCASTLIKQAVLPPNPNEAMRARRCSLFG